MRKMNPLAKRACEACTKDMPALAASEAKGMMDQLPDWRLSEDAKRISRRFAFKNFKQALAFVNALAELAEAEFHHPDITLGWGYAGVTFTTHSIDGLHLNDFIMAARADTLV
jgi:4a-hydroxytetrahydrobiopterin dehydratase